MARLSDFQQKPATAIAQKTLDVLEKNAKAAGFSGDWKATKITIPKVRGGKLFFHQDPFKDAETVVKRSIAMDVEQAVRTARRMAAHISLEEALDSAEPEEDDEDAEPAEESEQRSHGGGCGKSFTCDSGHLIAGRKSAAEIRRLGLNYAVF